jgi:hypothetical protein
MDGFIAQFTTNKKLQTLSARFWKFYKANLRILLFNTKNSVSCLFCKIRDKQAKKNIEKKD